MEAITQDQAALLREIHIHRKEIAHELPRLLVDLNFYVKTDLLVEAIECLRTVISSLPISQEISHTRRTRWNQVIRIE